MVPRSPIAVLDKLKKFHMTCDFSELVEGVS